MKKYCKNCKYLVAGSFQTQNPLKFHDFACYANYPPERVNPKTQNSNNDCKSYQEKRWKILLTEFFKKRLK